MKYWYFKGQKKLAKISIREYIASHLLNIAKFNKLNFQLKTQLIEF